MLARSGPDVDQHETIGQPQRRLDRFGNPRAHVRAHHEAIDHYLDRVLRVPREHDLLGKLAQLAIDARPDEALFAEALELLAVLALPVAHAGRQDLHARARLPFAEPEHEVRHLLQRLARDGLAAAGAVRLPDAREEQAQVVGDFRGGGDGRARIVGERALLDRDRRRETVDRVDIGLAHLLEELPRVGRQGLDVASLTFGVDRVESERGFSGAREPRDHDQPIARNPDVDVAEIVLACAADDDPGRTRGRAIGHGEPGPSWGRSACGSPPRAPEPSCAASAK